MIPRQPSNRKMHAPLGMRYSGLAQGNFPGDQRRGEMPDRSLKVLVVDDEAAMREVLEMRLTEWGFHVVVAGDGAEAGSSPNASALSGDLRRSTPGAQRARAVAAAQDGRPRPAGHPDHAYGSIDEAVEAMKLGAHDFLTKPLDYAKLRATLAALAGELERRARSGTWSPA